MSTNTVTRLNAADVHRILEGVPMDAIVFVSYLAGRPPTTQALKEAKRAVVDEGISPRHFTGALKDLRKTKKGETVITLWVEERDSPRATGGLRSGAYRAFNPSLGKLLALEVLSK